MVIDSIAELRWKAVPSTSNGGRLVFRVLDGAVVLDAAGVLEGAIVLVSLAVLVVTVVMNCVLAEPLYEYLGAPRRTIVDIDCRLAL